VKHDTSTTTDGAPDASDVVDGPVGGAWLKDPATAGPTGADLEALPVLDLEHGEQTDDGDPSATATTSRANEPEVPRH
jgi:hypothetical protein